MGQILALILVSIIAYFGLIYIKEHRWDSSRIEEATPLDERKYYLDRKTTEKWLLTNYPQQRVEMEKILASQPDITLEFTGDQIKLDIGGKKTTTPYTPKETGDTYIKVTLPLGKENTPESCYLQWDDQGLWASHYITLPGEDKPILFRQRFIAK